MPLGAAYSVSSASFFGSTQLSTAKSDRQNGIACDDMRGAIARSKPTIVFCTEKLSHRL